MDREKQANLTTRVVLVSLALVVLFLATGMSLHLALLSMRKPPDRAADAVPSTAVRVLPLQRRTYHERLTGYGMAQALRNTEVAAEVPGVITWISSELEAGKVVREGDELVRLDDRDLAEGLAAAKARLRQAATASQRARNDLESIQKRLVVARREFETISRELARVRGLTRSSAASESELNSLSLQAAVRQRAMLQLEQQEATEKSEIERAAAEVEAAKAAVAQAQHDWARTVIRAPYTGSIESRSAQPSARVAPGTPLFRIIDLSRVEVPVALPASRFGDVEISTPASVRLSEEGEVAWRGQVARKSPTVNSADRTFLAYLVIESSETEAPVPPGAFVLAEIEGKVHRDVMVVPRTAFVGDRLYVAERTAGSREEAVVHERRAVIRRLLPNVALIEQGLEADEEVVVTNIEQIAHGTRVRIVASAEPEAAGATPDSTQ